MAKSTFTPEADLELIDLIQESPIIFNASLPEYKNYHIKNKKWMDISKTLNKSEMECKTRWETIRDTYARIKKKSKLITGSARKCKNSWALYNLLGFLETDRKEKAAISNVDCPELFTPNTDSDDSSSLTDVEVKTDSQPEETVTVKSPKSRKSTETNKINKYFICRKLPTKNCLANIRQDEGIHDKCTIFGKYVEMNLRELSKAIQIKAEHEICNILYKYKLLHFELYVNKQ